ncbi:MAG: biotin--[acetyl-CoA-carboxylase] ligase [Rickettsiella sp.]|nr:biotin--[acetyl-CoA-carboxylase] ligase [Rickettsiella sp.]
MSLLKSTLNLLADGKFHSEKDLSQFLGLPNSVVTETLQQLLQPAINLEKLEGKGYRIPGGLELLNEKLILNELAEAYYLLNQLEILTTIGSTNTYLLEKKGILKTIAVFSEQQTAGRGQFNRTWMSSTFGKNIALSILWHLPKKINTLTGLSLVIGVAVVQALEEYGLNGLKLKWPNDVIYLEKKLAGVLIEASSSNSAAFNPVVVGIGLNLYHPIGVSNNINQAITDIYSIQKLPPQRNRIAGLLLKNILTTLLEFQTKGLTPFIEKWQKFDYLINRVVDIQKDNTFVKGVVRGINSQGQLSIEIAGKIQHFVGGEIQINLN